MLAAVDNQVELMQWHYRLHHLPFSKLKQLALNGKIPKKLAKVAPPKCAGCLFGAMTKIPWHGKETKSSHKVFVATKLGECVSVNQMTSTELGFVAQLKSKLTKKRYCCATVFVDHFSCLRYIHPQVDDSLIKTVATKCAFETFAAQHGIRIQHYHCNNGRFSDNTLKQACHDDCVSNLPFVASTPTSKTVSPNTAFVTSLRVHASNFCTLGLDGPQWCTSRCGPTPCAMPCSSIIANQCWRMAHQD